MSRIPSILRRGHLTAIAVVIGLAAGNLVDRYSTTRLISIDAAIHPHLQPQPGPLAVELGVILPITEASIIHA